MDHEKDYTYDASEPPTKKEKDLVYVGFYDPRYTETGKRIAVLRQTRGLTQVAAARLLNISPSFYGHIERGTRKMSIETLCKIVRMLDGSVDFILSSFLYDDESLTIDDARRKLERVLRSLETAKKDVIACMKDKKINSQPAPTQKKSTAQGKGRKAQDQQADVPK